jgi:two-component system, cell cycle response regulator DivK
VSANAVILVVEDNEKSLKLVRDLLIFHGYRTLEARTGADGVILARAHHPDLILMDIEMPVMDGVTALRQIRADPSTADIPVLAVTASAMRADRERYIGAGFDGYFIKPIDIKEFPNQIRAHIRKRAS